jgi:DNA-binding GntR family transcriptional regulator
MRTPYPELHPTDLTEQTYDVLKERILARQLKPGERISIGEVASALGVSRTPVTGALKQLAQEGPVAIVPRVGTFVSRLTARDVEETFEVRQLVEAHAARSLFENGKVEEFLEGIAEPLARMERAMDEGDYSDYETFITADRDMHMTLVELTGNSRLVDIYRDLNVHVHITRAHYMKSIENARQAHQEHMGIVEAFRARDQRLALRRLSEHIERVGSRIHQLIDELGGQL